MMIDLAEQEYLDIEKNSVPEQSIILKKKTTNSLYLLFVRDRQTGLLSKFEEKKGLNKQGRTGCFNGCY
jgi:hypothetical protein